MTVATNAREESDILAAIFARVAEGGAAVTACAEEGMNPRTFWRRIAADEKIRSEYEAALRARAHVYAEEIVFLSDERPDMVDASEGGDTNHKAGGSRVDTGYVAWQKLRVDSRKWVISKLLPKKYADKLDLTHAGPDGGPVQAKVIVEYVACAAPGSVPLPASADS